MYRLWKIEYYEEHTKVIKQDYTYCKSKTELIKKIERVLKVEDDIEDIAFLKPTQQNQP